MCDRGLTCRGSAWVLALVLGFGGGAEGRTVEAADSGAASTAASPSTSPPPLEMTDDEPLLLDEPPVATVVAPAAGASGPGHRVDLNAACYVCHVNFKLDPFVQWHAGAKVGCVACHGASREHVADEANLTPPDLMYWPSRVGFSCYWCHPKHNAPAQEVLRRWQERCPEKTNPARVLCTDCHGEHRLAVRTIVWNKRTRVLISKTKPTQVRGAGALATPTPLPSVDGTAVAPGSTPGSGQVPVP